MAIRVAAIGTGNVGVHALRALITNPDYELTGVWVSSDSKAAKTLESLPALMSRLVSRRPPTWTRCWPPARSAVYTAMAGNWLPDALDDYRRILAAGVNVVGSSAVFLQYPWQVLPKELLARSRCCAARYSSLFVNGIDPGFANDLLPLARPERARASSRSAVWRSSTTPPTTAPPSCST